MMNDQYFYMLAQFKQEQLERAAREENRARWARLSPQPHAIKLRKGFSLRRLFARQS